mmetsp:Transcript_20406/g.61523  ORF Transcript_20406/g.61523 Transcript_20406/m.61523 type:complete len:241 (+) Transcript_20406:1496-2218(+)
MSVLQLRQVTRSPAFQAALMRRRTGLCLSCQLMRSASRMPKSIMSLVLSPAKSVAAKVFTTRLPPKVPSPAPRPRDMIPTTALTVVVARLTYERGSKKNWPSAFFGSVTHVSHEPPTFVQQGHRWPGKALKFQDIIHQSLRNPNPNLVVTSLGDDNVLLFTSSQNSTCAGGSTPLNLWMSTNCSISYGVSFSTSTPTLTGGPAVLLSSRSNRLNSKLPRFAPAPRKQVSHRHACNVTTPA